MALAVLLTIATLVFVATVSLECKAWADRDAQEQAARRALWRRDDWAEDSGIRLIDRARRRSDAA